MEYRRLGGSGLLVSALSFGTATFGGASPVLRLWGETDLREATRLVDVALEAGVTLFDTADAYSGGIAEQMLGKAIEGRRDHLLVSTKAAFRVGPGPNDVGTSRQHLIAACDASLRRLGIDHIDLWQLHGFDALTPQEETLRALEQVVRDGKVRYVGCSNFSGWHLMKALATADRLGTPRHVAHQAYYSLLGREYEWELMPLAIDQGVGTVVWSPLAGGQLSGKVGRGRPAPKGSRTHSGVATRHDMPQEQFFALIETLESVAQQAGRSVSQAALRWVMQRPTVSTVVFGARNEQQLRENLAAADFVLSPEQMARLDAASARPMTYPYWHQQATYAERNPLPVPPLPKQS